SWFRRSGYNPIDWVIAGGESGAQSRPMHPDWAVGLLRQCQRANVPFHFKQWGHWVPTDLLDIPTSKALLMVGEARPVPMAAVGKKIAGRTLEGTTWNSLPQAPRV